MAIIGGAGNPVGGSFTGPAQALEVIGDHAYAFSGEVEAAASGDINNATTFLSFTTGNFYTVGKFQFYQTDGDADAITFAVKINGAIILTYPVEGRVTRSGSPDENFAILTPYTEVLVVGIGGIKGSAGTSANGAAVYTGSIHRTRD